MACQGSPLRMLASRWFARLATAAGLHASSAAESMVWALSASFGWRAFSTATSRSRNCASRWPGVSARIVGVGIGGGFQLRQILPHRHQARFETGLVRHRGKCTGVDLRRGFAQDDRRFRGTATRVPGGQVAETPIHCPGPGAGNMGGPRAAFCRGIGTGSRGGVDRLRGRRDARFRQDRLQWSGEGHHWIMRGGRRAGVGAKTWLGNRCTVRKATGPRRRGRPGRRQRKRALGVRSQGPCCPGRVSRAAQAKPASCAC